MSVSFDVSAESGGYGIIVRPGLFPGILIEHPDAVVFADEYFAAILRRNGITPISINAAETAKSLDAVAPVIEQMRRRGANRQTQLLVVGGGIVQDLATFIASIYMRGLTWCYVPTTLLSMVDSCIGGKSSINVGPYKNLVGTFHPPKTVLVDPHLAATLSTEQIVSGLVEAAKICFCRGEDAFVRYLSCNPSAALPVDTAEKIIVESLRAKKWFIEIDEFDKKERMLLNFGHTFGHAIEGASHFHISHGIAVGLGILCALEFERRSGANYSAAPRVRSLEDHLNVLLRQVPNLNKELRALQVDEVVERFESDKKHSPEHFTLILISGTGEVVLTKLQKSAAVRNRIRSAVNAIVRRADEV